MGAGELLAVAGNDGLRIGLLATTYGFGLRHGIDWDHIAAIADVTSSQPNPRRSMALATLYALGHGAVVFILGVLAIVFADYIPESVDGAMERIVGVTLLTLGVYVFYALVRYRHAFRMRSRWMVVFSGVRNLVRRVRRGPGMPVVVAHEHEHPVEEPHPLAAHDITTRVSGSGFARPGDGTHSHHHHHVASMPDDPFATYGRGTSFAVGMIHGVGAETPTQVLLFITAAGAGGKGTGVVLLACFLAGLITSNTAIAVATTFGFLSASRNFKVYVALSLLIATFSIVLGTMFVLGQGAVLPAILTS